jgi:hypothetical protein
MQFYTPCQITFRDSDNIERTTRVKGAAKSPPSPGNHSFFASICGMAIFSGHDFVHNENFANAEKSALPFATAE